MDEELDEFAKEPEIELERKVKLHKNNQSYQDAITYQTVLALLLECYEKANEIGWETKALDAFSRAIRKATY